MFQTFTVKGLSMSARRGVQKKIHGCRFRAHGGVILFGDHAKTDIARGHFGDANKLV
jgi:hypothetical protein